MFEYVLIFLEEDPKERSNFALKIQLFIFFLKFGLASRKTEASQGFWYHGVGADILFETDHPPICIAIHDPVIAHFP